MLDLLEGTMTGTSDSETISTQRQQIADLARQMPDKPLLSLNKYLTVDLLREAFNLTRKDGAVGIDRQTAADYEANLEMNLKDLVERAKSGAYRAPPVRRTYIPKADGSLRPLGIPTFEDKVLQRAVVMLMEPIYEHDFMPFSYGFRPGRSAHHALEEIWQKTSATRGGWVLDADIQKFFDMLDHQQLMAIVRQRVADGVILRLIGKWLNAGAVEGATWSRSETGTPQGGVISPLLANIYLHEVLDRWFVTTVKPRMRGQVFLVRYADDFVMGFTDETDAARVMEVLPKRFGKYGLTVHPEKTRIVAFRPPEGKGPGPGSFDFLGFTHFWGKSRRGRWIIKRKTAAKRLTRALDAVREWCRANMHKPIDWQRTGLARKILGHCAYYGITGNARSLGRYRTALTRIWKTWLGRRSQKAGMTWERFQAMLQRAPLPPIRVVHSIYAESRAKPTP